MSFFELAMQVSALSLSATVGGNLNLSAGALQRGTARTGKALVATMDGRRAMQLDVDCHLLRLSSQSVQEYGCVDNLREESQGLFLGLLTGVSV